MKKNAFALFAAVSLAAALSFAADKEKPAADAAKPAAPKEPMYSVTCPDPCAFSVHSHDKAEVVAVVKQHAKTAHHTDMTDKDIEAMIKTSHPKK